MLFESFNFNLKEKRPEQKIETVEKIERESNPAIVHKIFEIGAPDGRFHKVLRVLTLSLALSGIIGKEAQAFSAQEVQSAQEENKEDIVGKTRSVNEVSKEEKILGIIETAKIDELRDKILDLKSEIENKLSRAKEPSQEKLNGFLLSLDKISVNIDRLESNFDNNAYEYLKNRIGQVYEKFSDFENSASTKGKVGGWRAGWTTGQDGSFQGRYYNQGRHYNSKQSIVIVQRRLLSDRESVIDIKYLIGR